MAVFTKKDKPRRNFPPFLILKRVFALILCLSMTFSLCACESSNDAVTADPVFAFDTLFEQKIWGEEGELFEKTAILLRESELIFSHTLSEAELYRLNEAGEGEMSDRLSALMSSAVQAYELSGGAFDPALGELCELWDFGKGVKPSDTEISEALDASGADKLVINGNSIALNGAKLNLGGIAKGAAVGEMLQMYKDSSVTGGVISCSSAVGLCGTKTDGSLFKIGIRDPDSKDGGYTALLEISDCLISTSGDYERFFIGEDGERYHHIIDSKTGYPVKTDIRSVTVVADISNSADLFSLGALTDALSTALFANGISETTLSLLDGLSMEAVFVTDTEIFVTDGLYDKITVTGDRELKKAV